MNDATGPYDPTEQEVLDLVKHLTAYLQRQERAGLQHPENAARIGELQRIAELVHRRARTRQEHEEAEASLADSDEHSPVPLPRSFAGKLKLLKDLEITLTTVRPDGTTLAEKVNDREGVNAALRKGAALYKTIKAELDQQRKAQQVADEKLQGVRDMLLLWKLNTMRQGPAGQA